MLLSEKLVNTERLRMIRLSLSLKQKDIAQMAQISTAYYSEIETGKKTPSLDTTISLSRALGIDINKLITEDLQIESPDKTVFDLRTDPVEAVLLFSGSVSHLLEAVKSIDESSEITAIVEDLLPDGEGNEEPTKHYISALGEAAIKSIRFLRQLSTTPEAVAALMNIEREFEYIMPFRQE